MRMAKVINNILQVNNIDLIGKSFNGMDLKDQINSDEYFSSAQTVVYKLSSDECVEKLLNDDRLLLFEKLDNLETNILSVHSVLSITSPALLELNFYNKSDIVHFHQFHNTKLSLYSLLETAQSKKIVISLHDPWFLSGRCVHSYSCERWKIGCGECPSLKNLFPMDVDNSHSLWKLKKNIFEIIDCDIIVPSQYMYDLVKQSPIMRDKRIHHIPLGVNIKEFSPIVDNSQLRRSLGISKDEFVIFTRAQSEFKGSDFLLEALNKIEEKVTLITCDQKNIFDSLPKNIRIIDLGILNKEEMIKMYRVCDVFLMPSKSESFGMTAVEAMACSKPVIIFDNTALPSVTKAPDCGILAKNNDAIDLRKKIKWIIDNPEVRIIRGELGRKIVEQDYDIDITNAKIKKLYSSILKRKTKPNSRTYPKPEYPTKDIELLKKRLKIINRKLGLRKKTFPLLKNEKFYFCSKKYKIDYSNYYIQELIKNYNEKLYSQNIDLKRRPINTFFTLLIYDRKKFVNTIKERLKW